jgi:hypothetical protein
MTTPRKYSDAQIVAILQEHQGGVTAKEIVRHHGIALTPSTGGSGSTAGSARSSCSA